MPGHDKTRIVGLEQNQLEEFVCGICQDVLNKPVVTQCCRQSYCRDCIEEWLRGHYTCPNDRQPLTIDGVSEVPRFVINLIDKLKITCDNSDKGCPEVITIGTKKYHLKMCMYNQCKTCGCDRMGDEHDCLAYLMQKNLELTETNDKLNKERLEIDKIKRFISMESAIMAAKKVSCSVVCAKNFCPEWKNDLIKICDDAIRDFDPSFRQGDLTLVTCIRQKINLKEYKRFGRILTWKVTARAFNCYATTDEQDYSNLSYHYLKLSYDSLSIEMSAK